MPERTVLEINRANLSHNLDYFRSLLNPETKLMVMVKAFGYGLGNPEISKILEENGVDYLGVAFVHEGVFLREAGIQKPIMVMNPHEDTLHEVVKYDLEPEVYGMKILHAAARFTKNNSSSLKIHIKIETGMNRLGFEEKDFPEMIKILNNNKQLEVVGILSHLSSAEDEKENAFTIQQIQEFQNGYDIITAGLGSQPLRHILNTAGTINFPEYQFDMVRLGIGVYGVDKAQSRKSPLKIVCSLKTVVSQIKLLAKGQTVGYNRAGIVEKDKVKIAIVATGYADGIFRSLGNGRAQVWINGQLAPTFGNICMDMFMVDITALEVSEGDSVEIFGENQSVETLAKAADTIPYELFTAIGERVERVYI
jgi:alanine racemase